MFRQLIFLSILAPSGAIAQTFESAENRLKSLSASQSGAPSFIDPLTIRNSVEIRSGSDKGEASINFGFKSGSKDSFNFSFITPIDKEKKEGALATLDGLSNSIRFNASYGRFFTNLANYKVDLTGALKACTKAGKLYGWSESEVRSKFFDEGKCEDIVLPEGADNDSLYNTSLISPTAATKEKVKKELQTIRKDYLRAGMGYKSVDKDRSDWVSRFKVDLTVGSEEFKFLESDLTTEEKANETEWAFGLGWQWVNFVERYSISAKYRREKSYDASNKVSVCSDTTVQNIKTCKNTAISGPTDQTKNIGSIGLHIMRNKWALSPVFTYDFEDDEHGIEIPIYFIRNATQSLNGGLSFGWTSEEEDLTAQIFIGVPFSTFN